LELVIGAEMLVKVLTAGFFHISYLARPKNKSKKVTQ